MSFFFDVGVTTPPASKKIVFVVLKVIFETSLAPGQEAFDSVDAEVHFLGDLRVAQVLVEFEFEGCLLTFGQFFQCVIEKLGALLDIEVPKASGGDSVFCFAQSVVTHGVLSFTQHVNAQIVGHCVEPCGDFGAF